MRVAGRRLEPPLAPDEQVILTSQGGYREHLRSGWRLGRWCLTSRRLVFFVQTGVVFETLLSDIQDISVEKQRYVGGRIKDVIVALCQREGSTRPFNAFLIVADLETWRRKLNETVLPEIDEDVLEQVMDELDGAGKEMVRYLWEKGHATISELAELIAAPSHMDALRRIRGIINPAAERILGNPLLVFERARVDDSTGESILFSWWMTGRKGLKGEDHRQAFLDIFDEGDRVEILMELVGVREEDILVGVGRDKLVVSAESPERRYHEEIALPGGVSTETLTRTYANNVLAITLRKLEGQGP